MTVRRRFYPSTPSQREPGKTVAVEMLLRPEVPEVTDAASTPTPEPSGGCVCNVGGVALLLEPAVDPAVTDMSQYQFIKLARPNMQDWRLVGTYVGIDASYSYGRPKFRAVLAGITTCSVTWTWTLDTPPFPTNQGYVQWWDGVQVIEQDGTLLVTVMEGWVYPPREENWWAELRMQATCGGEPAGTLVLRPYAGGTGLPLPE